MEGGIKRRNAAPDVFLCLYCSSCRHSSLLIWISLVCPVGGEVKERVPGIPMKSSVSVPYSSLGLVTQEKSECPECPGAWNPIAKSWQRVISSVLALPHPSYHEHVPRNNLPWNYMGRILWAFQTPWQSMERTEWRAGKESGWVEKHTK